MKKIHPVTVLFLGAVPALAASADVRAALGMSLAVLIVLLGSTLLLGLIRKLIPDEVRLPAAVLTVAGFAAMTQMLLNAFLPNAAAMLGLYLAVLAVDLMLFSGAEDALSSGLGEALLRALLRAVVFAVFVFVLAALREVFGAASFAGNEIAALRDFRVPLLVQPSGGLVLFAVLLAVVSRLFPGEDVKGALTRAAVGHAPEDKEA